jgi:hypothetical protein
MSQTVVSTFSNVSLKCTPLGFVVKFCQNFQDTLVFFFLIIKKKIIIVFKDSGIGIFGNPVKF